MEESRRTDYSSHPSTWRLRRSKTAGRCAILCVSHSFAKLNKLNNVRELASSIELQLNAFRRYAACELLSAAPSKFRRLLNCLLQLRLSVSHPNLGSRQPHLIHTWNAFVSLINRLSKWHNMHWLSHRTHLRLTSSEPAPPDISNSD